MEEELSKEKCKNYKVDDRQVEEISGVTIRLNRDDAMANDDAELNHLNYCYDRFHVSQDAKQRLVVERA